MAEVWGDSERRAFKRIKKLLAEKAIIKKGYGSYEVVPVETAPPAKALKTRKSTVKANTRQHYSVVVQGKCQG